MAPLGREQPALGGAERQPPGAGRVDDQGAHVASRRPTSRLDLAGPTARSAGARDPTEAARRRHRTAASGTHARSRSMRPARRRRAGLDGRVPDGRPGAADTRATRPRRRRPRPPPRARSRPAVHAGVGVDDGQLVGRQPVLDQERPGAHLPQRHPPAQMRDELRLGRRQPEQGRRPVRPRPVAARRRRGSRSPPAGPGPARPARTRPHPSCRGPTAGGARPRSTPPGPATASTTTGATAPRPGWRGSPMPRPRRHDHAVRVVADASVTAPSPACNHAVAQVMRIPSAAEWYTADRSRTTRGASRRMPGDVGPSNMPRRSPATSRRSSSATFRPSAARPATSVPTARAASCVGVQERVDHHREGRPGRWARRPGDRRSPTAPATARSRALRSVGSNGRPRLAAASEASSSHRAPGHVLVDRRLATSVAARRPDGVERVEPDRAARAQRHGLHPPGAGQRAVLTLGVHHPGPSPEHRQAPQIGLHERALAPADLPDHDHVGIGEEPAPVELEGVVGERRPRAGRGPPGHRAPPARPCRSDAGSDSGDRARTETGTRRRDAGWWPRVRGCAMRRSRSASGQAAAERERAHEGVGLVPVATSELEPGLSGGLLDATARLLERVGVGRAHGDVAREAVLGVAVGELDLAPGEDLLFAPSSRRGQEAAAPAQLGVGDVRGAGLLDLARRLDRARAAP